jgi:hypothetical protein
MPKEASKPVHALLIAPLPERYSLQSKGKQPQAPIHPVVSEYLGDLNGHFTHVDGKLQQIQLHAQALDEDLQKPKDHQMTQGKRVEAEEEFTWITAEMRMSTDPSEYTKIGHYEDHLPGLHRKKLLEKGEYQPVKTGIIVEFPLVDKENAADTMKLSGD